MTIVKCSCGVLIALTIWARLLGKHPSPFSNSGQPDKYWFQTWPCTNMRYSTCRYLTHAHAQNRWQQTNISTLQKQNNPEQSLIEVCYQHLSYSLKLAVKKCIIEYYIKQPDMLIIWSKFFQNMKVNNWYWKLFPSHKGELIKHTQSYIVETAYE